MEQEQIVKPMKKITGMLDILICLLLFISALYKGGFYIEDSLFVNMIICMLGLICLSVKIVLNIRDNRKITKSKLGTLVDICVMLMPVAYFLPVLFGKYSSKESAIFESIRYVNFAVIYFIVRTTYNKKIYLTSLVIIGVILAVLGIDEITYRAIAKLLNPLSITYLQEISGKISSTLQYANITALFMLISSIIVQNKIIKNLPKLQEINTWKFRIVFALELFSLILLQSAIILTTSRMNLVLMIITTIIHVICCIRNKNKKCGLSIILMLIASFILVTSIDSYMLVQNNFMICFTYIITFILIVAGVLLSCKFKVNISKIKRKEFVSKKPIILMVCIAIILLIIMLLPSSLRLSSDTIKGKTITRNIYMDLQDTIDLDITFSFNRNESFELHLYELDENFSKKIVVSFTQDNLKDNKYIRKLNISEDTESLMFTFTTFDSDVSIEDFRINNNKVTLSYLFLPDTMVFRLKDTIIRDSNNTLRLTYYLDALKLFNKSKLVGHGGEGFKARYQEVQTQSYVSSEVHSAPLQILVESGLVGLLIFISLCTATCIIVYRLFKGKNEEGLLYFLILTTFLITSMFDLVFSFGIMIYLFAVIVGLIIGEYKKDNIISKDKYELDNKSILGMLKIATLSISLMALFVVTLYSLNIYRASMIVLPYYANNLDTSYERVGLMENKIELDKYNVTYLTSLLSMYDTHIELLNESYILTQDEDEKFVLKTEINNYIARQKDIADNIIEYEYYNKYAIDKVARCYFKRYVHYADIFEHNFKNDEIAYVFYVGYAVKLTDRITQIGKVNVLAHKMAYSIYNEYLPIIEKQNKLINSDMLQQAIGDMKQKQEEIRKSVE